MICQKCNLAPAGIRFEWLGTPITYVFCKPCFEAYVGLKGAYGEKHGTDNRVR